MKKIFILCHNQQRDRQFDSLLAHELKKDNMVWLHYLLKNDRYNICLLKPDVVVLPEIRNEYTLELARRVKEWGGQVVVRHGEMGITEESIDDDFNKDYKRAIFGNVDCNGSIDLMLVFGKTQAMQMQKYRNIDENKIRAIGNPILDPYFTPDEPGTKPKDDKKTILFAAGFPYADRNQNYVMPEAPIGASIHSYFKRLCNEKRSEWIKLIQLFAETYPDWQIKLRPHSGERIDPYKLILKDKCEYVAGPSSRTTLRNNDIIVHAGSTCAFEMHLLGIPGIIYSPITHDVLLKKLHPKCDRADKFMDIFEDIELGKSNINPEVYKKFEEDYIGPVDGKAHKRAAEYINSLPPVEKNDIPDGWPPIKEPAETIDPDIALYGEVWSCGGCSNRYFVVNQREMVKCPYCGIANIRIVASPGAQNVQGQVNSVRNSSEKQEHGNPIEKHS